MTSVMLRRIAAAVAVVAGGAGAVGGPVVVRDKPHDWVLRGTVRVSAYPEVDRKTGHPSRAAFDFTSAAVVFPIATETAGSTTKPPAGMYTVGETGGRLMLNDSPMDDKPTYLAGDYPCGTRLGKWVLAKSWQGEEVELQVSLNVTCFRVTLDEAAAGSLGWPAAWPGAAATALKPQLFVDELPGPGGVVAPLDMTPVKNLVAKWTGGKDPKSIPPLQLAKFLAGEVMQLVQVSGNGLNYARTGELEGFNLQGAAETAVRRRGSEFDLVCLLAAVYRQAGLPCRTVIGFDVGEDKRDGKSFLTKRDGSKGLRGWVEFALPDPGSAGGLAWVPVDIVRMRRAMPRAGPLDKPWPYFGTHDELDGVIPVAFQFHPPTTVVAHGSPALWGWLVTPKPPEHVQQTVRFEAVTAAMNLEEQERRKQRDEQERKKNRK